MIRHPTIDPSILQWIEIDEDLSTICRSQAAANLSQKPKIRQTQLIPSTVR